MVDENGDLGFQSEYAGFGSWIPWSSLLKHQQFSNKQIQMILFKNTWQTVFIPKLIAHDSLWITNASNQRFKCHVTTNQRGKYRMRSLNQLDPNSPIWQQTQTTFTQKRAKSLEISPALVVFAHWQRPCWSPETPPKLGRCSCGPPPEGWLVKYDYSKYYSYNLMIIYNA